MSAAPPIAPSATGSPPASLVGQDEAASAGGPPTKQSGCPIHARSAWVGIARRATAPPNSPLINLAAVSDSGHAHSQPRVVDGVDHAIITHAYPPLLLTTLELLASHRTRLIPKRLQLRKHPFDHLRRQFFQFFPRTRLQLDRVLSHAASRLQSTQPSPAPAEPRARSAATERPARLQCPPKAPCASSGRSPPPSSSPSHPSRTVSRPRQPPHLLSQPTAHMFARQPPRIRHPASEMWASPKGQPPHSTHPS